VLDLQRDALLGAGVDKRHLFQDRAGSSRRDRPGLAAALAYLKSAIASWSGSWTGPAGSYRIFWRR
jgi:hypothetical protein